MDNYNQYNSSIPNQSQQQQQPDRNMNRRRNQQNNHYSPNQNQFNNMPMNNRRQMMGYSNQPNMQNYHNQRPNSMQQGRYQPYNNMQSSRMQNNRANNRTARHSRRREEQNVNNNYNNFSNNNNSSGYNNFENYNQTQQIMQQQPPPAFNPREKPCRTLFVRNVEYTTSEQEIRDYFSSFGDIREMFALVANRGMVFLSYYDIRASETAKHSSQNKYFNGRIVDVHFSFPKENVDTNRNPGREDYQGTLFVTLKEGKVPPPTNEQFYDHFSQFGEVIMVRDFRDHVYQKFVEFFDCRACHAAYDGSIGQNFMGGIFDIKFAWDKSIKQMSSSVQKNVAMTGHKHNNQSSNKHHQHNRPSNNNNHNIQAHNNNRPQNTGNHALMNQAQQLMQMLETQNHHPNETATMNNNSLPGDDGASGQTNLAELLDQLAQPLKALNSQPHSHNDQDNTQYNGPENMNPTYYAVDTPNNTNNYATQPKDQQMDEFLEIEPKVKKETEQANSEDASGDKISQLLQMLAQAQNDEQDANI